MNKIILLLLLISFKTYSQTSLSNLAEKKDFETLSGLPLTEKYGEVSALKIVYDLKAEKLYYISSKHFKYHYDFCVKELGNTIDYDFFNSVNYSEGTEKQYLLASINYYKTLNTYGLEIAPIDEMNTHDILFLINQVSKSSYIGDSIQLLLNSTRLLDMKNELQGIIPLLEPSKVYSNLSYQAIGKYKNCGVLRYVSGLELENNMINPLDIIVLNHTPMLLPPLAGILITEFQTPLSHLSILGQNRKIPIAAYKHAFNDSALLVLDGQKVCLEIKADTFNIIRIDTLEAKKQVSEKITLQYNLDVDSVIDIEHIDENSFAFVGNKAANFGVLYHISKESGFRVPESAFAIPFFFYHRHVSGSQASVLIDSLLKCSTQMSTDSIKLLLIDIREKIKASPIDISLLNSINSKVLANDKYLNLRFRSSTNAEDAKGFSGAGIYTSKTGIYKHSKKTYEKAIKDVWASLWSYEAFVEREYYNIRHEDAYMGILVHRSFPDEKVNGVAITKNLYRPQSLGFVVNAQIGDESVVEPKQGMTSDQFICYPDAVTENVNAIDIITQSNLHENSLVMSPEEIKHLANQLEIIKRYMYDKMQISEPYEDFGLDVELKLESEKRILYIKQVRLYND